MSMLNNFLEMSVSREGAAAVYQVSGTQFYAGIPHLLRQRRRKRLRCINNLLHRLSLRKIRMSQRKMRWWRSPALMRKMMLDWIMITLRQLNYRRGFPLTRNCHRMPPHSTQASLTSRSQESPTPMRLKPNDSFPQIYSLISHPMKCWIRSLRRQMTILPTSTLFM